MHAFDPTCLKFPAKDGKHPFREVGGRDGMPRFPERQGESARPAAHVEHAFLGSDSCALKKRVHVGIGVVFGREGLRPLVPVDRAVAMASRFLQLHPFGVPVGGGEQGSEALCHGKLPFSGSFSHWGESGATRCARLPIMLADNGRWWAKAILKTAACRHRETKNRERYQGRGGALYAC